MPRRWSSGSCCATVARGSPERAPDRVNDGTDTGGSESARDADAVTTLIGALKAKGGKRGVASLCIGGGEATAVAIELI